MNYTKDQVIEIITNLLVEAVGWIEKGDVSPHKEFVRDMHIADDDLMAFDTDVIKYFGIKPRFDESPHTGTIEKVANLVLALLARKP